MLLFIFIFIFIFVLLLLLLYLLALSPANSGPVAKARSHPELWERKRSFAGDPVQCLGSGSVGMRFSSVEGICSHFGFSGFTKVRLVSVPRGIGRRDG